MPETETMPAVATRRFTTDQYKRMIEVGILSEGDAVELIEGKILKKGGPGMDLHSLFGDPGAYAFTRAQYEKMAEEGILGEDDPVELIEGEIVETAPQNTAHIRSVAAINRLFLGICPSGYYVRPQSSLPLDDLTKPEPDLVVVKGDMFDFSDEEALDVVLVVEVADSSLRFDRTTKRRLYAAEGFPEYWVVNLIDKRIEVHRDPQKKDYATTKTYSADEVVSPLFAPGQEVSPKDMIP